MRLTGVSIRNEGSLIFETLPVNFSPFGEKRSFSPKGRKYFYKVTSEMTRAFKNSKK